MTSVAATNGNGAGAAPLDEKLAATSLKDTAAPANGHAEEGGEDDDEDDEAEGGDAGAPSKKKKKKRSGAAKRKAKAAAGGGGSGEAAVQSEPPRVPVSKIFPNGAYPVGEEVAYDTSKFLDENRVRTPLAELKERERIWQAEDGNDYNFIRQAAEVHRQVRQYAQRTIKPGMTMTEIAEIVEDGTRALVEAEGFESGIGFPTGLSLNEVAAHYTPNAGDKRVLQKEDVLKVDFGVHRKGRIVDSAFTLIFDEDHTWQPLLDAVRAATNTGIKEAGIDARLQDIGEAIQETMESHEFEINGKLHKVKCVRNLNGHNINPYSIHGGKSVPIVKVPNLDVRMEESETFAIETFGTTGQGYVVESGDCSHYARKLHAPHVPLRVASARPLLYTINKHFGSLPFCRRYLDRTGEKNYLLGLKHLVSQGVVQDYPPLADVHGSMTAQFEHTILLRPTCKEVVSRGDDY